MSVPVGKRSESPFEASHQFFNLRKEVTALMLTNFGFSKEKYEKQIEHFRKSHESNENCEAIVARMKERLDGFNLWFIQTERDRVIEILQTKSYEFTFGNSIWPSDTPAKEAEYCERREYITRAICACYALKQCVGSSICLQELKVLFPNPFHNDYDALLLCLH